MGGSGRGGGRYGRKGSKASVFCQEQSPGAPVMDAAGTSGRCLPSLVPRFPGCVRFASGLCHSPCDTQDAGRYGVEPASRSPAGLTPARIQRIRSL